MNHTQPFINFEGENMSYEEAQARYDAMTPDDRDDDLYELDLEQLHHALEVVDCDQLSGWRYYECQRRVKLIESLIADMEAQ